MSVFVIGDTHLSLTLNKSMDIFGDKWTNYVEKLEKNWNAKVKVEDFVVIAGDVTWGMNFKESEKDFAFLNNLPGTKYILKGNHDYWWSTLNKIQNFFEENNFSTLNILHNNAFLCENIIICGSRGWFDEEEMYYLNYTKKNKNKEIDNRKILLREVGRLSLSISEAKKIKAFTPNAEIIVFLHYPPIYADYKCTELLDIIVSENIKQCYFGHIHTGTESKIVKNYKGVNFNLISSDFIEFEPFLIKQSN